MVKEFANKNEKILLVLCVFGGFFGLHHFYCGNVKKALIYFFTAGLFGLGWIVDIFIIVLLNIESPEKKLRRKGIAITTHSKSVENPYKNAVPYDVFSNSYIERRTKTTPSNYVVFDTETTGLEPEIDKIIEISAIKFKDNKKIDKFSTLVNPLTKIDNFITELTGIKQSDLDGMPTIDRILPDFFEFIEGYTLVAHNAPFDIKMLACECYRNNIQLCSNEVIDTVNLAKKIIPQQKIDNYKLATIKNYLGLEYESHRALSDCEVCAKLYQIYLAKQKDKKIIVIDNKTGEVLEEIT